MRVPLLDNWSLTTDHASASYGRPVLVIDGTAYGPADTVELVSHHMPAAEAVRRLTASASLDADERALVKAFIFEG